MADTDTETLPNGTGALSAEEEDERMKQRPADIDADVREMERRKRVEALMSSKLFREELERVLDQQMNEGADAPLLQRIKEMVGGRLHTGSLRGPSCVLPINDIRGIEGVGYEKGEKILRCKLAAVYRLVDLFGWTQTGIASQITARLNTAVESVLTTPRGLLPHEVTASSLAKVDMQGAVQDQGTTNFPVNIAGFSVHAAVHSARPDVRCVLHLRAPAALAVSASRRGLLPLSCEAALLGEVAYHTTPSGVLDNEERDKMVRVLGPTCKILFLTSNGALCCGATLEEAFYHARHLITACEVQLRVAAVPVDDLILLPEETRKEMYEASRAAPVDGAKWRVGGDEFEALMRMLDNAGFRTGYIYRHPLVKNDVPKPKNDVEVPPAVSSLGYLLEEEEMYKQGLWKKGQGKTGERTRWLNSPNVYQKVEVLETGTNDPKRITKWVDANNEEWVQDGSPAHSSTPVKIDAALQFVPKNTNPKEFKALQQQIKENRRADKISAGPQSHILEGVTWDEANRLNAEDASTTHTGDHVVLMGAASKGIIQRGYQHNATVYAAPYAKNPFDQVTDRDIDEYRRTVERRQNNYDTDLSESEAVSAAQVVSPSEDESRDEHRVLRIETKQAPVRSQPEVVLSDVDATDFLNTERAHAERTRGNDPNQLCPIPATNKKQTYSRCANFDNLLIKYDNNQPNCRQNLNNRLEKSTMTDALDLYHGNFSSKSSLNSILSIEWDHRDFPSKTRSLPSRQCKRLYRTRSHSGFINAYLKDPQPRHYHLPKCKGCGQINSYKNNKLYCSYNNIHLACQNFPAICDTVKVQEKTVPVFHLKEIQDAFVESEEYHEDSYLISVTDYNTNINLKEENARETKECMKHDLKQILLIDGKNIELNTEVYKAQYAEVEDQDDLLVRKTEDNDSSLKIDKTYSEDKNNDKKPDKSFLKNYEVVLKELSNKRAGDFILKQVDVDEMNRAKEFVGEIDPTEENVFQDKESINSDLKQMLPIDGKTIELRTEVYKAQCAVVEDQEDLLLIKTEDKDLGTKINKTYFEEKNYDIKPDKTVLNKYEEVLEEFKELSKTIRVSTCQDYINERAGDFILKQVGVDEMKNSDEFIEEYTNITNASFEGEYLNFSGEMDFELDPYTNPVKHIAEKDVRDYLMPINVYLSNLTKKPPKKQVVLDTISEESKCLSDDSHSKIWFGDNDTSTEVQKCIDHIVMVNDNNVGFDINDEESLVDDLKDVSNMNDCSENMSTLAEAQDSCKNEKTDDTENNILQKKTNFVTGNKPSKSFSFGSSIESQSFDSTAEFERNETASEIIGVILSRLSCEVKEKEEISLALQGDIKEQKHTAFEILEDIIEIVVTVSVTASYLANETQLKEESYEEIVSPDVLTETFSMTQIVQEIDEQSHLNQTDDSDLDTKTYPCKIAESVIYFVLERAFFFSAEKNKIQKHKGRKAKHVITVIDPEDIMFTAFNLFSDHLVFEGALKETPLLKNDSLTCENSCNVESQKAVLINKIEEHDDKTILASSEKDVTSEFKNATKQMEDTIIESLVHSVLKDISDEIKTENGGAFVDSDTEETYTENPMEDLDKTLQEFDSELCEDFQFISGEDYDSSADKTHVLSSELNTAFLDEGKTSSPIIENRNLTANSVELNYSDLYENDVGSPFTKQAPVISMNHRINSGGLKYWVSFRDGELQRDNTPKNVKKITEIPSFIPFDSTYTRKSQGSTYSANESFHTANESSLTKGKKENKRIGFHSRNRQYQRGYYSWPPYDESLFYRIISKFRMSESFDPSDLGSSDVSL